MCLDDTRLQCDSDLETTCAISCLAQAEGARCAELTPSNGVVIETTGVADLMLSADATFDTGTGAVTGAITRPAGSGLIDGIGYTQVSGPAMLGVFTFRSLTINTGVTVRLVGDRAGVFVVGTTATVIGSIELSAGCANDRTCAGPGGGAGAATAAATGCGAGGTGASAVGGTTGGDSGGGGGGGGQVAGTGGRSGPLAPGAGGAACLALENEPLVGGSGGGNGGAGAAAASALRGGGGGGAFQLTALTSVEVRGSITASGAGGGGGLGAGGNAAAGSGGGAGGAILIEAPFVSLTDTATLSANGGGGGGGGALTDSGLAGASGQIGSTPAAGGAGGAGMGPSRGGNGGAGTTPAVTPVDVPVDRNGGGGGGAVGRIFVRAGQLTNAGLSSPAVGTGPLRSR